jgi:hypothetical protein
MIPRITSLADLSQKTATDPRYARLAIAAAENLGGDPANVADALRWLRLNAQETTEAGVVAEINHCRGDLR